MLRSLRLKHPVKFINIYELSSCIIMYIVYVVTALKVTVKKSQIERESCKLNVFFGTVNSNFCLAICQTGSFFSCLLNILLACLFYYLLLVSLFVGGLFFGTLFNRATSPCFRLIYNSFWQLHWFFSPSFN